MIANGEIRYIHKYRKGTKMTGINNPEVTVLVDDDNTVKLELDGVLYQFRSFQAVALAKWLNDAAETVTGDD